MNAKEVYDKIQNLQSNDVYSLADCVLEMLKFQEILAAAMLRTDEALPSNLEYALRDFLGK